MADNNRRQPYRPPMSRNNYYCNRPQNHFRNPKSSNPNSTSSSSSVNYNNNTKQKEINPKENEDVPRNIVGTCPFMCPVEEKERRERLRDLAVFERLHGNPAKTSSDLAVKKFCRTISPRDEQVSSVRPISVLQEALNHVLGLLHSSDHSFVVVHDFVFDRTRSIRQDLSMQNLVGDQVVDMYERIVKFHIISHHHLHKSTGDPSIDSMRHLNMEQLMKALTTLLNSYQANQASDSTYKNEAEFYSYYLLLLLGSSKQGESVSLWFRSIPSLVVKTKEMRFARRLLRYFRSGNYMRFIHTTEEEASYLQYCIIEPYINENLMGADEMIKLLLAMFRELPSGQLTKSDTVRILALSYICYGGYKLQPYPLVHISKLLMMKEADVESLCVDCHHEISLDGSAKGLVSTKQAITSKPTGAQKYYPLISDRIERLGTELSELL